MAIAIAEPSGALVYFQKMDNTQYGSIKIAQAKAETAAQFRRPTKMFTDALTAGHLFFLTFEGISAAPGGLPIISGNNMADAAQKIVGVDGPAGADRPQRRERGQRPSGRHRGAGRRERDQIARPFRCGIRLATQQL